MLCEGHRPSSDYIVLLSALVPTVMDLIALKWSLFEIFGSICLDHADRCFCIICEGDAGGRAVVVILIVVSIDGANRFGLKRAF